LKKTIASLTAVSALVLILCWSDLNQ